VTLFGTLPTTISVFSSLNNKSFLFGVTVISESKTIDHAGTDFCNFSQVGM
jgi:hypothetical protein